MNMNTTVKYRVIQSAALAAALLLTACSESDAPQGVASGDALAVRSISVGISTGTDRIATRALGTEDAHTSAGNFANGEKIYCYMPEGRTRLSAAYTVTGGKASPSDTDEPLVASQTEALSVYAYAPYDKDDVSVTERTDKFSVQQDQRSKAALLQSDLLYAEGTVAAQNSAMVNAGGTATALTFSHQLSKLVFQPYKTNGAVQITGVRLVTGHRTTALDINVGRMATPAGTAEALSDPITTGQPLTVYSDDDTDSAPDFMAPTSAAVATTAQALVCIIPPQTLAAGASLVQVDIKEQHTTSTITYTLKSAQTLAAGQAYTVPLPVSTTTEISVIVDDFTPVTWTYGDDAATKQYTTPRSQQYTVAGADGHPVTFDMVYVEGGAYNTLGGVTGFTASLTDYYMGKTEVTCELYKAVCGKLPSEQDSEYGEGISEMHYTGDKYPVTKVNQKLLLMANGFIQKLNAATEGQRPDGYVFTLPTEAQWEYAARGGVYSTNKTYAGYDEIGLCGWYQNNSGDALHHVGQLLPNELGLYDMTGNVWEWCIDGAATLTPSELNGTVDYCASTTSGNCQNRGGSYGTGGSNIGLFKVSARHGEAYNCDLSANVKYGHGFRLCLSKRYNVGDVMASNGKVYRFLKDVPSNAEPIAMVAYVGSENHTDGTSQYSAAQNHGLAIALYNYDSSGRKYAMNAYPATTFYMTQSEAISAASNYSTDVDIPAALGASDWFLPSEYQLMHIFVACGATKSLTDFTRVSYPYINPDSNRGMTKGKLDDLLVAAGGDPFVNPVEDENSGTSTGGHRMWTSTYLSPNQIMYNYNHNGGGTFAGWNNPNYKTSARAVFAF